MAAAKRKTEKSADAFRSIGEAAAELGVQTHVIRYWESKFPAHVKPIKRPDGRRFFKPNDLEALRAVQTLVHQQGMTLKGAKALLAEQGVDAVLNGEARLTAVDTAAEPVASPARDLQDSVRAAFDAPAGAGAGPARRKRLASALEEMTDLKARLDAARLNSAA